MNSREMRRVRRMLRLRSADTVVTSCKLGGVPLVLVGEATAAMAYHAKLFEQWASDFDGRDRRAQPIECEDMAVELWRDRKIVLHALNGRPVVPVVMLYAHELASELLSRHYAELREAATGPWISALMRVHEYVAALPEVCRAEAATVSACAANALHGDRHSLRELYAEAMILQGFRDD